MYELNRIELLRDFFVRAYERSCQQRAADKQNLVPPDIFRLCYRQALTEVAAAIVRSDEAATDATVSARTPVTVTDAHKDHFIELALAEFKTLHTRNVVRFGIRPQQFSAWQEKHPHL